MLNLTDAVIVLYVSIQQKLVYSQISVISIIPSSLNSTLASHIAVQEWHIEQYDVCRNVQNKLEMQAWTTVPW